MPVIPTFETQGTPQIGARVAEVSPTAASATGAALAEGGGQIENLGRQFEQRYADARRQAQAADAVAGASQQLGDLQFKYSKIPDRQAAYAGFQQDAKALRDTTLAGISDPLVRAHVQDRLDQESVIRGLDTQNAAFQLESSARRGDLDTRLNQYAQSAATTTNPLLKAKLTDDATADIGGAVAAGWLHPEEGAQHKIQFTSRVQQIAAEQDRNAAHAEEDPQAAAAFATRINDPASYPGLLPQVREQLGNRAISMAQTLTMRSIQTQMRADAQAERDLRRGQAATETALLAKVYSGQAPDLGSLVDLAQRQQISPGGLEAVHSAMNQAQAGRDDPRTALGLFGQLDKGTLQQQDIYDALPRLSKNTAVDLMRALASRSREESSAVERADFATVKTALSGAAVEQGGFAFDKAPEKQAQAQLWTGAQAEWTKRVRLGGEDSGAVRDDIIQRYTPAVTQAAALPKPRLGAVASAADVTAISQRTVDAFSAGQLSPEQFADEKALLVRYGALYAQQAASQAKAAAARAPAAKPGAAPKPSSTGALLQHDLETGP